MKNSLKSWSKVAGVALAGLAGSVTPAWAEGAGGGGNIWLNWRYLWDLWEKGGGTMWFLLALSVVGLTFTLERLVRLRRSKIAPRGFAEQADALWRAGKLADIVALCKKDRSILAEAILYIVKHRKRAVSDVAAGVGEVTVRELRPHFRRTYPLNVVATLAPLFGLFGTVVGMMEAFETFRLLGEHGDPSIFAGSIAKALITTIVGLAIAMPALAAYHYFRTRANRYTDELEQQANDLIDEWLVAEELTENK